MGQTGAMNGPLIVRSLANWLNLSTPLGLALAGLGRARVRRGPRGLFIAEGSRLGLPRASAFTVGNVVLTPHPAMDALLAGSPRLLDHEDGHAWQYTYCLGLPFLPLYGLSAIWSWLRTGDTGSANFFERQAGLDAGGYQDLPRRSVLAALGGRRTPGR